MANSQNKLGKLPQLACAPGQSVAPPSESKQADRKIGRRDTDVKRRQRAKNEAEQRTWALADIEIEFGRAVETFKAQALRVGGMEAQRGAGPNPQSLLTLPTAWTEPRLDEPVALAQLKAPQRTEEPSTSKDQGSAPVKETQKRSAEAERSFQRRIEKAAKEKAIESRLLALQKKMEDITGWIGLQALRLRELEGKQTQKSPSSSPKLRSRANSLTPPLRQSRLATPDPAQPYLTDAFPGYFRP